MITSDDRRTVLELIRLGIWDQEVRMGLLEVTVPENMRPLFEVILKRQNVDDLHHAPCCPANHYHHRRLVFSRCTCGAESLNAGKELG